MKNSRLAILPLLFTFIVLMLSCSEEGTYDNHYSLSPESFFEILQMPEVFDGEGGRDTIRIKTNLPWKAVPNETWMTVSPSSGVGSAIVTVTSEKNELPELRAGEIVFGNRLWLDKNSSSDEVNDMLGIVTIKQSPTLEFSLSADTLFFTPQSDGKSVSITSNLSWEASTRFYWFTLSKTSGEGDGTLVVEATENTSIEKREGTITFKSLAGFSTLTVVQEGVEPVFEVGPDTLSFTYKSTSAVLTVTSNQSWKVSTDDSWLSLSSTGDMYGPIVSVQATENTTSTSREGAVTFTAGDSTYVVPVTQTARTLSVDTESLTFTSAGGSQTITVEGDSPFDVTSDANWLTLDIRGTSVVVKAAANTSITEREALIIVSASGLSEGTISQTISVTQEAAAPTFSVTPTSASFTSSGGSKTLTVTSNQTWTASSDAAWLTLSETSGTGNATLSISAETNNATSSRSGIVTFKAGSTSYTVSISQEGAAPTFSVTPTSASFNSSGGSKTLTISSNQAWTVSSDAAWLTLSETSGSGNATLSITAETNNSISSRSGTATFKAGGMSYTVNISQEGAAHTFNVTPTSASFTSSGGSISLTITSNQSWTASTSATWLTLSNDSGSGDATLTVTAEANTSTSNRTEAITFTAGGTSYRVSVTQEGAAPTFSVTPTSAEFTADGGSKTLTITSNQTWTVSSDVSWLTLSETSGTGNATLSITAETNNSTSSRSGTVTFKAGGTSYTVNISQEGAAPTFSVTPTSASFTSSGGSISLTVTSNQSWTASTSATWLSLSRTSGKSDATLTVEAMANTSMKSRSDKITFKAGDTSYTVSISQEGAAPTFSVTPTSAEFTADGGSKSLTITSNQMWTASASASWILLSKNAGNGNATLTVTASANTSIEERTGEVTFEAGGNFYTVSVIQAGAIPTFSISPTSAFFTSSGGSETLIISSNHSWIASTDVSWLTLSDNSGTGDATLSLTAEANNSTSGRFGLVTFSAGEANYIIDISQNGVEEIIDGHAFVELGLPSGLLWATCNVGANNPEDYGDYFAWGETKPNGSYEWSSYKYCNGSNSTMTKYCTDSSYGIVDNKTVLDLEDDAAHVNWGGSWRMPTFDEFQELIDNCTWTWTIHGGHDGYKVASTANGNSIFLPAAGYRDGIGSNNVETNGYYWSSSLHTSFPYRAWRLLFILSNSRAMYGSSRLSGHSVRPVYSESTPMPTFALSANEISFTSSGGNKTLTVTSNQSWTVSSDVTWLSLSDTSGSGDATLTISATANTSINSRSGTITFKAGNTSYTVSTSQAGATPTFSVTPTSASFSSSGGNKTLTITSNQSWTVSSDVTWLSLSKTSGTGDGTLTLTAESNSSAGNRSGEVTFVVGGTTYTVSISQEGRSDSGTHAYVDLGLPSGLLWATCNVGANSPEEYGDYFAWGETTTKSNYGWNTYKWCKGSENTLTKYNTDSSYGTVDNKTILDLEDDAAYVYWGGSWRMPTHEEFQELLSNCTWTWTTQSSVFGYKVTSKVNGNSIFLPAAGEGFVIFLRNVGSDGYYGSSSLNTSSPYYARCLDFSSDHHSMDYYYHFRDLGLSVRPVCR